MSIVYFRQFTGGYYSNRNLLAPPLDRGEDTVFSGSNMWHVEDSVWKRRPGFSRWTNWTFATTDTPRQFFPYFNGTTAALLADCQTTLRKVTATTTTTVYTKGTAEDLSMVATDTAVYFASTNNSRQKMLATGTTSKAWCIDGPSAAASRANQAGTLDAVIGYRYLYVYKDSTDGHISDPSGRSSSTGAITNQDQVVTVTGTTQARVDKIDIYRTKDGGSTYYYLATINNPGTATTTTYTDSTVDSSLNTALIAPSPGANEEIREPILSLCNHQNRIWGVYTVTATGATAVQASSHDIDGKVNGVAHECFPDELSLFNFPGGPIALASSSYGLVVFTKGGQVYLIAGQSKYDFSPAKILDAIPVTRQQNVAQDGDTMFVFTSGKDIVKISQSTGIDYIGTPLSSTDLSTFDPATTTLTIHRVGGLSYLFVSDGANKILVYNLKTGTWSTPWTVDGTTVSSHAIISAQTTTGTYDVLIGPKSTGNAGYIWKLDTTTNQDDGSVTFVPNLIFGNMMLANPTEMIQLDEVITEASHQPTVTILFQEISGATGGTSNVVDEPPLLSASSTYSSKTHRFDESTTPLIGRHLQVKLAWSSANETSILYSMAVAFNKFGDM